MPSPRISWGSSLPDSERAASRRLVAAVVAMAPSAIAAITRTAAVSRRRTGVRCSLARATVTPNGLTDALAVTVLPIPRTSAWRDYLTRARARQLHLGVAPHTLLSAAPARANEREAVPETRPPRPMGRSAAPRGGSDRRAPR